MHRKGDAMFKRKIEKDLKEWKDSLNIKKKAFILKGMRQIGKTTIIKEFAKNNFKNVVYINFKIDTSLKKAFEGDLDVSEIIKILNLLKPDFHFVPFETVIIFDEVQECSGARASIKPFMEEGKYDIIASGSLLGIKGYNKKYKGGPSVGFEHTVYMRSMDFEEYLWAKGISEDIIKMISESFAEKKPINDVVHSKMLEYFKEYICIGGMPAVLDVFLKTNSFQKAREEQRDILESFKDDFAKHLNESEEEVIDFSLLARINKVFDSIPAQLAKENKKFIYSILEKKGTSLKYDPAIEWLHDYGLVEYCYNLNTLDNPLEGNKIDNIFKLYITDTGLFISMLDDDSMSHIILGDMGIYKGTIYENIVADAFIKNKIPLYYYSKDSGLEIDFIMKYEEKITLIEVKATNGNTKSSKTVLSDKIKYPSVEQLVKLCGNNISVHDHMLVIPYYLTYLIR